MKIAVRIAFLLVALVNTAPILGVVSTERLSALYGITISDANIEILLRHRAVLFGVVGILLCRAAFDQRLRPLAVALGLLSMVSFVVVAFAVGDFGGELRRIVAIDVGASIILLIAALASRSEHLSQEEAQARSSS